MPGGVFADQDFLWFTNNRMMDRKHISFNMSLPKLGAVILFVIVFGGIAASAAPKPKAAVPIATFSPYPPMVVQMRIGLAVKSSMVRCAVWQPGALFINERPVFALRPGTVYTISGGFIQEIGTHNRHPLPSNARSYVAAPDHRIWINNRWYRGCLEVISYGHVSTAVNLLDMEAYLLGVVPSEMPSSWNLEALKAQAVAARSYAWAHNGNGSKWRSEGFDVVPDVRDQAYKGLAAEAPSTTIAVQHTMGMILKDAGRVKAGFYRAWVGDTAEENFNIRRKSVNNSYLEKITGVQNIVGVTVKQWDPNGRAHSMTIMGKKSREVSGVKLAQILGLDTAVILDVHEEGNNWVFTYRGPGNGARGLSQNGANMLAKRGWRFDQILHQFYGDADGSVHLDLIEPYKAFIQAQQRYQQALMAQKAASHAAAQQETQQE